MPEYRSITVRLVEDELNFCCMYSFLRETRRYSCRKVGFAMGVAPNTIMRWRNKKQRGQLTKCDKCAKPQPQLTIKKGLRNRVYFERSPNPPSPLP